MFDRPEKTLRIAHKAIGELDSICREYFGGGPFQRVVEINREAGTQSLKYVKIREFPEEDVERKAMEALLQIRYAFDQIAWAACAEVSQISERDTVYFPWTDTFSGFKKRLRAKTSKIPPELWTTFLRTKPYGTGDALATADDVCRALSKMANRKHSIGVEMRPVPASFSFTGPIQFVNGPIEFPHADMGKPMRNEITVLQGGIGSHFGDDIKLQFYIAFDKSTLLKGQNVVDCLSAFAQKAERTLGVFKRRFEP